MLQVFVIVLGPVLIGMWLRSRFPGFADRMARPVKIFSMLFLFAVVAVALIQEWETLMIWGPVVGLATLAFNLISLGVGYYVPRAAGIEKRQAIAIGMEIGIHNATLAIAIALSPLLLNNATMAVPAAIYGLIAFITAAIFGYRLKRSQASSGGGRKGGRIERRSGRKREGSGDPRAFRASGGCLRCARLTFHGAALPGAVAKPRQDHGNGPPRA